MSAMRMKQRVSSRRGEDREIETIYRAHCTGMQIDIMRIGELFEIARSMLRNGANRDAIGAVMVAFIQKAA